MTWTLKRAAGARPPFPGSLVVAALGLLTAWSCTVVDKKDYTFTDNPENAGDTSKGGTSGKGGSSASGGTTSTGGSSAKGGTGGTSAAGEAGMNATGGTGAKGGSGGKGGTGGTGGSEAGAGGAAGSTSTGVCGDGTVDDGEACDLGDMNTDLCAYGKKACIVCTPACRRAAGKVAYCGDGKLQKAEGEECDDGNDVNESCSYGDQSCTGCSPDCTSNRAYCGDGKPNAPALTQIKLEYVGIWDDCGTETMPLFLNGVAIPNLPQSYCGCPSSIQSVIVTDPALLAAVRPNNNVLELRGVGAQSDYSYYALISWARLTFSFSGAPDYAVVPIDPYNSVGTAYLCGYVTWGAVTSDAFSVTPVEQCDSNTSCSGCETPLPKDCAAIKAADRRAASGVYRINPAGGSTAKGAVSVFCDMRDTGVTYETLGFGQYGSSYAGYSALTLTDFQDPVIQAAFVWLYDRQGGIVNLAPGWVSTNCAFGVDGGFLKLDGVYAVPADLDDEGAQYHCNLVDELGTSIGGYTEALMKFSLYYYPTEVSDPPIVKDFFDQKPPTVESYILDSYVVPAFFVKKY